MDGKIKKGRGRREKEKKIKQEDPYHTVLKPGPGLFFFYLSVTNSSFHSSPLSSTFSPHLIYCLSTASLAILE